MATAKKTSSTKKASAKGAAKASGKRAAATGGRSLTVRVPPNAKILRIGVGIEKAFKQSGCPGCRSGIDRIVFEDPILNAK